MHNHLLNVIRVIRLGGPKDHNIALCPLRIVYCFIVHIYRNTQNTHIQNENRYQSVDSYLVGLNFFMKMISLHDAGLWGACAHDFFES